MRRRQLPPSFFKEINYPHQALDRYSIYAILDMSLMVCMAIIGYRIEYYKNSQNSKEPVKDYIDNLGEKIQAKIFAYLGLLRDNGGRLRYPYASHVKNKIWELRIDFGTNHHRIFYFICIGRKIILLHAFLKKSNKTPQIDIEKAINNYNDFMNNN